MKTSQIIAVFLVVGIAACNAPVTNKEGNPLLYNWDTVRFPRIDTISIGIKSDSGHYALLTYYIKRTSKEEYMIEGSDSVKFGNESWHVETVSETKP